MTAITQPRSSQLPLVSVVIPTWDRRASLERCLRALTAQTYERFEVVVVDDCSSDATPQFLERFAAEHPDLDLRYLVNETNIGANRSRNRGILEAGGELVAFTDSDCVVGADWLEALVRPFTNEKLAAVTGTTETPPPANIYELTYRGTNRVVGSRYVNRLVGGNMCIRRDLLLKFPLDEDLKYGCDEEGIYLRLRAAGYLQSFVPDAVVRHEHRFNRTSLFRQARIGGAGAAWLVYKYHLPPRLDLLPFMLAYLTLPLILFQQWFAIVPVSLFTAGLAALAYNDIFRKRKTLLETIRSFPVLLLYYHFRLAGYVGQSFALRFGKRKIQRVRLRREPEGLGS